LDHRKIRRHLIHPPFKPQVKTFVLFSSAEHEELNALSTSIFIHHRLLNINMFRKQKACFVFFPCNV
jgi:hypothetical protein